MAELPEACLDCGGELEECGEGWEQFQEELPEIRAVAIRVSGKWARCRSCGRRVRGRHPRQTSEAVGAAAAQVGPRALALACSLHKEQGLSVRKTAATMRELDIRVSPGGLVQAMARIGDRPTYKALVEAVRQSPVVSGDETSWHVNVDGAWLWIMTTEQVTVYGIREGRGYEEAASLLGADYRGVLVRDGWAVYPKFVEAEHQTCLAHLLRRCREMSEVTWGRGREVPGPIPPADQPSLSDRHPRDQRRWRAYRRRPHSRRVRRCHWAPPTYASDRAQHTAGRPARPRYRPLRHHPGRHGPLHRQAPAQAVNEHGQYSSMNDAADSSENAVAKLLQRDLPTYLPWFRLWRARRNAIKTGVEFAIRGPQWNEGVYFVRWDSQNHPVAPGTIRLSDAVEALRQSIAVGRRALTLAQDGS